MTGRATFFFWLCLLNVAVAMTNLGSWSHAALWVAISISWVCVTQREWRRMRAPGQSR